MQKYLLDENLSRKLVEKLLPVFVGITHLSNERLVNSFDANIWSLQRQITVSL
jgi:hypothetical protein